jgi:hypothetical protein
MNIFTKHIAEEERTNRESESKCELHHKIVCLEESIPRSGPEEILEKTWGTIKGIDQETLREIIEDEDYVGY